MLRIPVGQIWPVRTPNACSITEHGEEETNQNKYNCPADNSVIKDYMNQIRGGNCQNREYLLFPCSMEVQVCLLLRGSFSEEYYNAFYALERRVLRILPT